MTDSADGRRSAPRQGSTTRRRVALAVVVFLFALEAALQLAAGVASLVPVTAPPRADAGVVCVGDSFTAGIGASSTEHGYPAVLERLLRDRGRPLRVANAGMPGQDSGYMLARVGGELRDGVKVCCALLAFNDTWSRPPRAAANALEHATTRRFEWRWRTGRLLAIALRFGANSWFDAAGSDPVPAPPAASADDAPPAPTPAAGFALLDRLGLTAADAPPPRVAPRPAADAQQRIAAIEATLRRGAFAEALAEARAFATAAPETLAATRLAAIAANGAGDAAARDEALGRLAAADAAGRLDGAEERMIALLAIGDAGTAAARAEARLQAAPDELVAAIVLQDALFALGRLADFRAAAARALRNCNRLLPDLSGTMARHLAEALGGDDPPRSARLFVAAALLDGNVGLARAKFGGLHGHVPWPTLDAALTEAAALAPEAIAAWRPILRGMLDEDPAAAPWAATLEAHLVQLGEHCHQRGIRFLVVGYPFRHDGLEGAQRRAAARLGAPFVDVRAAFAAALQGADRGSLFVANGHCNDAGYELLAKVVAEAVLAALD
jgi:lysophospholipase L1-like esterase